MSIQMDSATGRVSVVYGDDREVSLTEAGAAYAPNADGLGDSEDRAADAGDRARVRQAVAALVADVDALTGATAPTAAEVRAMLARTDRALVALLRYLGRRGL